MRKISTWLAPVFAGFLLGALVSIAGPAGAKDGAGPRALVRRMVALEGRIAQIEAASATAAADTEARLEELQRLTQLLDQDGTYVGYVDSVQVWSHYCEDGARAAWIDHEGYPELSCEGSGSAPSSPGVASGRVARPLSADR